jgi:hypothetical protein
MLGGRESRVRMMIELASEDGATTYFTSSPYFTQYLYDIYDNALLYIIVTI